MSIVLTTDVFCDHPDCGDWEGGVVTGRRSKAKEARAYAKRNGWSISRQGDFCPRHVPASDRSSER